MDLKAVTCSLTGHRPQKFPWKYNETDIRCNDLKIRLEKAMEKAVLEDGYIHFISGMALGSDIFFAELALKLKAKYPEKKITLECAIPHRNQEGRWSDAYKMRYHNILRESDRVTFLSERYTSNCMMDRNKYMVNNSSLLFAVYSLDEKGGTYNTIKYAQSVGVDIEILAILN